MILVYGRTKNQTFTFFDYTKNVIPDYSGVQKWNNHNTLGMIILNTPSEIKSGPFSHEIHHFQNLLQK